MIQATRPNPFILRPKKQPRLGKRAQQVLDFISSEIARCGYPPSFREIGEAVGLRSSSTVWTHLQTLERLGFLKCKKGQPRSIQLTQPPLPSHVTPERIINVLESWLGSHNFASNGELVQDTIDLISHLRGQPCSS